jgi:hypothetical protein
MLNFLEINQLPPVSGDNPPTLDTALPVQNIAGTAKQMTFAQLASLVSDILAGGTGAGIVGPQGPEGPEGPQGPAGDSFAGVKALENGVYFDYSVPVWTIDGSYGTIALNDGLAQGNAVAGRGYAIVNRTGTAVAATYGPGGSQSFTINPDSTVLFILLGTQGDADLGYADLTASGEADVSQWTSEAITNYNYNADTSATSVTFQYNDEIKLAIIKGSFAVTSQIDANNILFHVNKIPNNGVVNFIAVTVNDAGINCNTITSMTLDGDGDVINNNVIQANKSLSFSICYAYE